MLSKFLFSVSVGVLMAAPVMADGGPAAEPPPPPPAATEPAPPPAPASYIYDWTGGYVGVQIGYAFGDAEHVFANGAPTDDSAPDGILGGAHIGYQIQNGSWVYGLEGDFDYADVDGNFNNTTGGTSSGSTDVNYQGTLRLRIGFAMDRTLVFVSGGGAIADVDYGGGPAGGPCCGFSATPFGWTVGGGFEHAFMDSLSGRVEYRYTDYGTEDGGLAPGFPGVNMAVDLQLHTVYAGLSYHF